MNYKNKGLLVCAMAFSLFSSAPAFAQGSSDAQAQPTFNWVQAPGQGNLANKAKIKLEGELIYLDEAETKRFLVMNGNPATPGSYTVAHRGMGWFSIFSFSGEGYVKDDEKIDADALLTALKESNVRGLEVRKQQNMPLIYLDGWHTPPRYDKETKRLEWATKLHGEDNTPLVNFTTRILGRGGYMSATLVSEPTNLDRDISSFKEALKGYEYNPGERYSEFTSGDKVAAYGLGALVVGGAAAAIASKGGFKFIIAAVLAALAAAGAFFKKIFGKS